MAVVITLVHGTFGRLPWKDASWAGDRSHLRRRFASELGDDVVFVPFRWSGMNWPAARYRAAHRLREHFGRIATHYPHSRHYVVAHSHGGNVVLYALRDAEGEGEAATLPSGAVCLSTPFITAQPRPVTLFRFVATYAVILVTLFAVVANIMGRLLASWIVHLDPGDTILYAAATNEVWLEFALCAVLAWYATGGLIQLARGRRARIVVDRIRTPVRIYRSIGDEATAVLATSSFFSWLGTLAWSVASALTIAVAALFAAMTVGPFMLVCAGLSQLERLLGGNVLRRRAAALAHSRRFWAFVATAGTMSAFAFWGFLFAGTRFGTAEMTYATVIAALVAAVISCSALSGLGYGLTSPFLEVTAEATPVGTWEVHLFTARTWDGDDGHSKSARPKQASLAHSAAYGDEAVLGAIATWIRESERGAYPVP
jgi:hypothetical protein